MTTTTQNLLVELFVEELPPKALKKLGDAFATVLATSSRPGPGRADRASPPYASPRRLAATCHRRGCLKAADKAVQQKLMPVAVGLDAAATPPRRC
jgi:glycyl-tRNA synthetase beta chain